MTNDADKIPFRVLTLDGGGMRGLYTATLLECLADRFSTRLGRPTLDIGAGFDLIVGTSTGGILASALAYGVSARTITNLYREKGPEIFTDPQPTGRLALGLWICRNFFKAANSTGILRKALVEIFHETTLKQLYDLRKIGLCITAVRMLDERFRVFKTPHISIKDLDNDLKLVDICLATSAAPLILPLAGIHSPQDTRRLEVYADGGLAANNPVLVGLIEALQIAPKNAPIQILSIGTCSAPDGSVLSEAELNRGLFQWMAGVKALTLSMNAQASAAEESAKFISKWISALGREVRILRFPEKRLSEAHMKFLRMDLASQEALDAFAAFGNDAAVAVYSMCQDDANDEGKIIQDIFESMPSFKEYPNQRKE